MNLKQLRAFREVMLTGSVSEAARSLYRTQPTISALIAGLEAEIGYKLFERRGRRLHPQPEAHFLFEEATAIIDRLDSVESAVKSVRHLERGTIHMVAMLGPSVFLLPDLVADFLEGRDNVQVSLITRSAPQVERLVSAQQFDLGLADVSYAGFRESPLVRHEMWHLPCLCAVPGTDPLAKRNEVTAADLDGRPLGTLYKDHPNTLQLQEAFAAMDARLNIRIQTQYFIPLLSFVERGRCYSVVDPLTARSYQRHCRSSSAPVFLPFLPPVHLIASIMTPAHKPVSHLVALFISELRAELESIENSYGPLNEPHRS